jgi:hypothetical protein
MGSAGLLRIAMGSRPCEAIPKLSAGSLRIAEETLWDPRAR